TRKTLPQAVQRACLPIRASPRLKTAAQPGQEGRKGIAGLRRALGGKRGTIVRQQGRADDNIRARAGPRAAARRVRGNGGGRRCSVLRGLSAWSGRGCGSTGSGGRRAR